MSDPIIITCAITGSIHTPSMSPHLPVTAAKIAAKTAAQSIEAAEAGAAILHLHARDPDDGRPSALPAHFDAFVPRITAGTDAVINITTGGNANMTLDERLAAPMAAKPEMCSLNRGSMNVALYPMAAKERAWKHNWEKPFLEDSDALIFRNTPRDIAHVMNEMGAVRGARFAFECHDLGHLHMLDHFARRGLVKPPFFIQFVFGVLGGMAAAPDHLTHLVRTADRLFGNQYLFSVLAAGKDQIPMASIAAAVGGHVRMGLEDSLYIGRAKLAKFNAEKVRLIRGIVEYMGRRVATPAEARAMLALKGPAMTGFPS